MIQKWIPRCGIAKSKSLLKFQACETSTWLNLPCRVVCFSHTVNVWADGREVPEETATKFYLVFDGSIFFFSSFTVFAIYFSAFQLFRPEYHWRDLTSRNEHLVHQDWCRIGFCVNYILQTDEPTNRKLISDSYKRLSFII